VAMNGSFGLKICEVMQVREVIRDE